MMDEWSLVTQDMITNKIIREVGLLSLYKLW